MESALSKYEEFMEKYSDPRVKDWMLMGGFTQPFIIIAIYLSLVLYIVPTYMKDRKPYDLTTFIRFYNISQILICGKLLYMIVSSGWIQGEYSFGCQPVDYSNNPKAVRILEGLYFTYLLKIYELTETVVFGLRKKFNQVSSLHIYHHVSTFLIGFIGIKFLGGGMFAVPVILNLVIHIFMYNYYYLSALGKDWQMRISSWKSKLTTAQMIQFTLMIAHSLTAFQPECEVPRSFFLMFIPNIFFLFKMFRNFYKRSYRKQQ